MLDSVYIASRPFLFLTLCEQGEKQKHQKLRGDAVGQGTPADLRDIPYHEMLYSAIKLEEGRTLGVAAMSSQVIGTQD